MFINLHVHDAKGSLLDSIARIEDVVKFAKENRQSSIAITNHGSLASFVDFTKECNKNNIKPIIGIEAYEVNNMFEKADSRDYTQSRYHLVLLCKNQIGFQNLLKISSTASTDGFYKKPLISIDYIEANNLNEGLICLTACQAGRISRLLENNEVDEAKFFYDRLKSVFGDVYCELQSHNTPSQNLANKKIYDFIQKYNLPYVITTDAHMITKDQMKSHSIFIEIGSGREAGELYTDCYLQTEKDVYETLETQFTSKIIKKGIDETANIYEIIEFIDIGLNTENQMPNISIEEGYEDNVTYFEHLIFQEFDSKFGHMSKEEQEARYERILFEIPILKQLDYINYFIMLYMLVEEIKKRNIPINYSRGSGANCLCLFMLNVTQIDSVRWDLDFSRFANLGRRSVADFDFDISKKRRKEVVEIAQQLFGVFNVAPIATFNTLSTKVAIRDVGKVLDEMKTSPYYQQIPYTLRDEVAKSIPTIKTLNDLGEDEEKDLLLKDILSKNKRLSEIYTKFPLWFKYVMDIEGLPKSMGRHAAGTLITPKPIINYCPVCYDSEKNTITQIEMHNAMDDLKLIKMDFLGLETLDIIDSTLEMAGLTWDDVDINKLDLSDAEVFKEVYSKGNTIGIFQMESAEAKKMCIKAKVNNIEDVIVINAANRPGTKDSFPEYCNNKLSPDNITVLHEDLKSMFSKTHFVLLYQEQALQIFRYANFEENEVDNARRCIGKKLKDEMQQLEVKFREGLVSKNWNETQIDEIWALMLKQANYCFNRGHSVAYGLLSYLTAYLKTHYTKYFMTACMSAKSGKVEKLSVLINESLRLGIKILPPNVNLSGLDFIASPDKNEILFGLLAIRGLGANVVSEIIQSRPYADFRGFVDHFGKKDVVIPLIKAGALGSKNKMRLLKKYAHSLFDVKEYSPVVGYKTKKEMLETYGIDVEKYKVGKKVDKEKVLELYNSVKKQEFDMVQKRKYETHMQEFFDKYAQDEYMWEFDTLSIFLTDNPLEESYKKIKKIGRAHV